MQPVINVMSDLRDTRSPSIAKDVLRLGKPGQHLHEQAFLCRPELRDVTRLFHRPAFKRPHRYLDEGFEFALRVLAVC